MSNIGFFDSTTVAPSAPMGAVPAGEYVMMITATAVKQNKKGTGRFIEVIWAIVQEGPGKGRKVWQYINFEHTNATTQAIGQGELSAICRACGKTGIRDTGELHNIPVKVVLEVEEDPKYGKKNLVKEVLWKEARAATPVAAASALENDADDVPF